MCLFRRHSSIRNYDPKTRRIWTIGNISLSAGLSLTLFATSLAERYHNFFDALRGFFIGIALVCLIWSGRRMRHSDLNA